MSHKRQPEESKPHSHSNSFEEKRRRFDWKSVVPEVMKVHSFQHLLEPVLEPLIRRVVREEVDLALTKHLANLKQNFGNEKDFAELRSFKLHFSNSPCLPIFTGARIEGEEASSIRILLIDILTGNIVNTGPECAAKVEIVVLEGDFDSEESDNWTHDEFKNNIVKEREGKKPVLTGDVFLNLNKGIGLVGEISFTDNSSWTRSRRFRLGARVVDDFEGTDIREVKTNSFTVRDHRGELYKKHHPPFLSDDVWRLEKIGKDGAFHKRLTLENINTVKDFLTRFFIDPQHLRQVLGTGMSAKMWEATIEHARTCMLDKRVYVYDAPGSLQKTRVAFNVVGQVIGLLSECQYVSIDKLSEPEKADAKRLVIAALEHQDEVISFEDEASLVDSSSHLSNISSPSSSTRIDSNGNKLFTSNKMRGLDYPQPSASSPDVISSMYSAGGLSNLDDYTLQGMENMDLRYDQTLSLPSNVSNPLICDTDTMTRAFRDEGHLGIFDSDLRSEKLILEAPSAADGFMVTCSTSVAICKAQRRWTKISSVLKWFSIRKRVALKKSGVSESKR